MTPVPLTAQAVADLVGGRLLGNGDTVLSGVAPLDAAGPASLGFLAGPRQLDAFRASRAGAVLVREAEAREPAGPATRIVVADPAIAISAAAAAMHPEPAVPAGVDPTARLGRGAQVAPGVTLAAHVVVGAGARIGEGTRVGPGAVLADGVVVGRDCRIGARVVLGPGARLGDRVTVKSGAVIGEDGFGYDRHPEGLRRAAHVGGCVLEDDVDIGANVTIDRGRLGDTVIGHGTKIDNLVQVGHNTRIGRHCVIVACSGIAGSVTIGDGAVIGGAVGIADHVTIGAGATVAAKSGVFGDIPAGETWGGYPARPHRAFLRAQAAMHRLAPVCADLERLVQREGSGGKTDD